jgi:hypothetical protein
MPKIHGAEAGEVAQEFFYEGSNGNMKDAALHEPILISVHNQIDETIMAPIRKKYRKMHEKKKAKQ